MTKRCLQEAARQWAFVFTCLVTAMFMGAAWGGFIYCFNEDAGLGIGLALFVFTFALLVNMGWRDGVEPKRNRRLNDD